jgi:hypothetical protein
MNSSIYKTYGFFLASEFELPELLPSDEDVEPQVWVSWGDVPPALDEPERQGVLFQVRTGAYLLNVPNVARYLVREGCEIIVQPYEHAAESEVGLFLTSNCFPALLYQRGIYSMHASAIQTERGAVLFCGPSGNGKSTLLAAFVLKDYPMLADDVAGIRLEDGEPPQVIPAYPRLKLWPDMISELGIPEEKLHRLRDKNEKKGLYLPEQYTQKLVPLAAIYNLRTHNKNEVLLEPLADSDRVLNVIGNTAWRMLAEGSGQAQMLFQSALQIARGTHIARLTRPRKRRCLDELVSRIEQDLEL